MRGVELKDDGRAMVFGPFLRDLLVVHEHYKSSGERVIFFVGDGFGRSQTYEVTVRRQDLVFATKVRVVDGGVHEFGREEF